MADAWVMLKVILFLEHIFIRIRNSREKQQRMYSKNVRNISEAKFWIQHPPVFTKFELCIHHESKRCGVDRTWTAPKANLGRGVQGRESGKSSVQSLYWHASIWPWKSKCRSVGPDTVRPREGKEKGWGGLSPDAGAGLVGLTTLLFSAGRGLVTTVRRSFLVQQTVSSPSHQEKSDNTPRRIQ